MMIQTSIKNKFAKRSIGILIFTFILLSAVSYAGQQNNGNVDIGTISNESTDNLSEQINERLVSDADHIELSRLIIEFAYQLDHLQASTVYELCAEDVELRTGPEPVIGIEAVKAWGKEFDETDPLHGIRHVCGNFRFIDDGNGTARGISFLTAYYTAKDQPQTTVPFAFGEDQDTFVRTQDGWRLRERVWVPLQLRP
jgi:hypothetical protein